MRFAVAAAVALALLLPVVTADAPASDKSTAKYEVGFLTGMIDHHAMAVETGEMCIEKAVHEQLRALCESIVTAQSQEIAQMQAWLQDWYGVSHEPEMSKSGERQMEDLAGLEGADFEVAFLEMMIKHHQGAVRDGDLCLKRAEHKELIDLCQDIIRTQSEEIELMQSWLCDWYGRCQ